MKKIMFMVSLVIAIAGISVFVSFNQEYLNKSPFQNKHELSMPYIASVDSKNNIYLMDDRSKRLTKFKPDGEVQFFITALKRGDNELYNILYATVDSKDDLYVFHARIHMTYGYPERYEVQKYSSEGVYEKTVVRVDRSTNDMQNRDNEILGTIAVKNDYLYYILYKDPESALMKVSLKDGTTTKIASTPGRVSFISITVSSKGEVYISKLDGSIYNFTTSGTLVPVVITDTNKKPFFNAPCGLQFDRQDDLFISDLEKQAIYKYTADKKLQLLVDKNSLNKDGYSAEKIVLRYFDLSKEDVPSIAMVDEQNGKIIYAGPDGKIKFTLSEGHYRTDYMAYRFFIWVLIGIIIILSVIVIILFYRYVMNSRISVIIKELLIFIPVTAGSIILVSMLIFTGTNDRLTGTVDYEVPLIAQIASDKIDGDALERLALPKDFMGADYKKVQNQMYNIFTDNNDQAEDPWNDLPYSRIYTMRNGLFYIAVDWSGRYGVYYPYTYAQDIHFNAFTNGQIGYKRYSDFDSDLIVGVAPIRNSKGKIVGVYEAIIDGMVTKEANDEFQRQLVNGVLLSLAVFVTIMSLFTYLMLLSLRKLRNAINDISQEKWDTAIDIRTKDEVGDLGEGFNFMAGSIRKFISDITSLNRAYVRFVPAEFLRFLGKESIVDMTLGDQVQKEMSVLFSDIRSFTTLSESMTPSENFKFINAYLRRLGPVIRENDGFIDKYIGDAIMALFASAPENAVKAGIEMQKKLIEYNVERVKDGYNPIAIGVGIHTGNLMLGIVGEHERMSGTVISDNVNLASRLEGLTKMYGAGIIISDDTLKKLPDISKYDVRFLDKVKVKGKTQPVLIYEIFNADLPEIYKVKKDSLNDFENAIQSYQDRKFEEAIVAFNKILKLNDHDKTAMIYIERSERYIKTGVPNDWDGVEELHEK